jgi:hypothetical protein
MQWIHSCYGLISIRFFFFFISLTTTLDKTISLQFDTFYTFILCYKLIYLPEDFEK